MDKGISKWAKNLIGIIPYIVIILIALLFPLPIEIIDVFTLRSVPGFDIHIHFWRIVFEPFLGPLLYFNRGIYPLQEIPIAILWVLGLYSLFALIGVFKLPSWNLGKKKLGDFLGNLLLLAGIGFSIFAVLLFIPLPNNTIVNNSSDQILVSTHAHTEYSHDGLTSQKNMWEWHKRNGFDAFFITDHANFNKTLEFSRQQRKGDFPMDPLVMVGQEHSGSNHMSLLGLKGEFVTKDKPDSVIVDLVHQYGGAVIINHWFDGKGKEKEFYKDLGADGFEIENVGKELYYDRTVFEDVKSFCEENGLIMVGGLDYHGYGRVCAIWNAFTIPNWEGMDPKTKESAILRILRDRDQTKLKVLMYRDRPYHDGKNLLFSPFTTMINYFRTLNGYQVASWVLWITFFQVLWIYKRERFMSCNKNLTVLGLASALFLIGLGTFYFIRAQAIKGYSKVFAEYSSLLLTIGTVFLAYCMFILYIRFFRKDRTWEKEV